MIFVSTIYERVSFDSHHTLDTTVYLSLLPFLDSSFFISPPVLSKLDGPAV